ncbi:MAG: hypothetical protein WBA16_04305 [Nonlabens sp.]
MLTAIKHKDTINIVDQGNIHLGSLVETKKEWAQVEIKLADQQYLLHRKGNTIKVLNKSKNVVQELKRNPWWGGISYSNEKKAIKGVLGYKWATQLVDHNETLAVKIKNESQWNADKILIERSDPQTSDIDVALTLYGHLVGSKNKASLVLILGISFGLLVANFL